MKALAVVLSALLLSPPIVGAEIGDVRFDERVEVGGRPLALHGAGLLRYRWVFRAYVAALYLPPGTEGADALEDVAKRLEIEYFWALAASDIRAAAETLLARQLAPTQLRALRERIDRVGAAYRDVDPGDRYSLDYAPGAGTTLLLNGEPLVSVPGADFAAAYFGLWLGEPPLDTSLKQQLLGAP